jgi:hypothetical protein
LCVWCGAMVDWVWFGCVLVVDVVIVVMVVVVIVVVVLVIVLVMGWCCGGLYGVWWLCGGAVVGFVVHVGV